MAKRIQVKQQNGTMKDIDLIATHDENGDRIIDTYCKSNDPRLSDARTPTAHNHNVSEIDGVLPISKGGTGMSSFLPGRALVTSVLGVIVSREITSSVTQDSDSLLTSGGAYTVVQTLQRKIHISTAAPQSAQEGDIWFQEITGGVYAD